MEYTNREGEIYTFTEDENGNILWEGNFRWCRYGSPNEYDKAYSEYAAEVETDERLTLGEFKNLIYKDETLKMFLPLLTPNPKKISMVDPSGGPYLSSGFTLRSISGEFEGLTIESFEPIETGYRIIVSR